MSPTLQEDLDIRTVNKRAHSQPLSLQHAQQRQRRRVDVVFGLRQVLQIRESALSAKKEKRFRSNKRQDVADAVGLPQRFSSRSPRPRTPLRCAAERLSTLSVPPGAFKRP